MATRVGLAILIGALLLIGCSSEQDVGDANKPVPKGLGAPGAPSAGGPSAPAAGTPNPGAVETPK